jgi:two-component system, cell cycle sensor histidine kinase and response regulator CckA
MGIGVSVAGAVQGTPRRHEKWFRALLEASRDGMAVINQAGTMVFVNAQVEKLFGYRPEDLLGHEIETLIPQRFRHSHSERRTSFFAAPRGLQSMGADVDLLGLHKNGGEFPVEISLSPLGGQQGMLVLVTIRDITVRKRAEEALQASEIRYRRLFEAAQDGILILDFATGQVVDVNPFLTDLLGYSHAELVGKNLWEIGPVKDISASRLGFADLQSKGIIRYDDLPLETKDGRRIAVEFVSNVYPVGSARVIQCNIRDITRRKHAEESLRRSEEQLQQASKLEAVGRLSGGVAHDFNNLLSVILGSSELLLDAFPVSDPRKGYVEAITAASKRAASLTKQLLTFSRKQVLSPLVVDLNSIVMETGRMLPRVIGEHIEIVIVPSAEPVPVLADPTQIQQVLMNMAANARDAMPEGGKLIIEIANVERDDGGGEPADVAPGHYAMLTVSDTGAGMSPQVQSRAFDPFFTTKDIGKGTGLGLSSVYGIVKESGGSILVNSKPGKGTTFRIYLPRAKEEIIERAAALSVPNESLQGSETILLVEDQSEFRDLTREFLRGLGYKVLDAGFPGEAIQIAQQFRGNFDLLLTDVVMPGMNGRELAKQLRLFHAHMQVLYVSGFADQTLEQDVLDANDAFLAKPFLLRELAAKIRELFREPKSAWYTGEKQNRAS